MKTLFKYTLVMLLITTQSYCQQANIKSYDLVNDLGITDIQFGIYPKGTFIYAGYYNTLSEVKNKTVENVFKSYLSEQNIEWHHFNHDFRKKRDSIRDYTKLLSMWKSENMKFELLDIFCYKHNNNMFAQVVYCVSTKTGEKFINSDAFKKLNNRWYITRSFPKSIRRLLIGLDYTTPTSIQNILNKQPANEGERILLEQSLNSNGQLDLVQLREALSSIKVQAKTNTALQAAVLNTEFVYNSNPNSQTKPKFIATFETDKGGWLNNGSVTTTLDNDRLKVSNLDNPREGVKRPLDELTIAPNKNSPLVLSQNGASY
ncbi:hypothetical protein [Wenyingzhuangia sp. IMCC45574]